MSADRARGEHRLCLRLTPMPDGEAVGSGNEEGSQRDTTDRWGWSGAMGMERSGGEHGV